jgi:hypothetical protein
MAGERLRGTEPALPQPPHAREELDSRLRCCGGCLTFFAVFRLAVEQRADVVLNPDMCVGRAGRISSPGARYRAEDGARIT